MQTQKISDHELIVQYLQGNVRSFEILLKRHKQAIYTVIMSKVRDADIADEIFQESFIKIIQTIQDGRYTEQGLFVSYAARLARNMAIDHLRKRKREVVFSVFDSEDEGYNPMYSLADEKANAEDKMIDNYNNEVLHKL